MAAQQATLFGAGGKVGITEFSWNPTTMFGRKEHQLAYPATEADAIAMHEKCQADYGVPKCLAQLEYPEVSPAYFIPT